MKKRCLYILCGLPFAGKTTLARALECRLGIRRIDIDDINAERGVWDNETGMSPQEWANTYNEAYRRIGSLLSQGESVVDDSVNFTRALRNRLRTLAESYHAQTTVIYVDIHLSEVQRRWRENRQSAVRADVRESDFAHVLEHFEPPTEEEQVLRYDGSHSVGDWVSLTFLQEARDDALPERTSDPM